MFRSEHLRLAQSAAAHGELVLGGALADPSDMALILFRGESPEVARRFATADPYVREGLVVRWEVREWVTVVGEGATTAINL